MRRSRSRVKKIRTFPCYFPAVTGRSEATELSRVVWRYPVLVRSPRSVANTKCRRPNNDLEQHLPCHPWRDCEPKVLV